MRGYQAAVLASVVSSLAGVVAAADPAPPRGVGPEFASFYESAGSFTCVSNPSIKIPSSRINDDFCDCPDGSDEPGTAACSYLSPLSPQVPAIKSDLNTNTTLALPGFYCNNKGHIPAYITFTAVNDGICDYEVCCDGSDEYGNVGGVKCPDRCGDLGAEYRKLEESRQRSMTNALRKKKGLIADASRLRQELTDQIRDLETQIKASEAKVAQLEEEKTEIEKRESLKVTKKTAVGGKLGVLTGLAKQRLSELKDALTDVREQRQSYKERLAELESILSTFKTEYNPNFNDEGVKRAVRSWEDYSARDQLDFSDGEREASYEALVNGEDTIDWEEFETGDETHENDIDTLFGLSAYLPETLQTWLSSQYTSLRAMLVANGVLPDRSSASTGEPASLLENKAVQEATTRLNSARSDHNSQQSSKTDKENDLSKDYGENDIFRPLKGKCVSLDAGEYTYELCHMDKITQKSKKNGAHSNNHMGNFNTFDKITVNEEIRADGKGLGSGERLAMRYENGAHCWNGPNRSVMVVLACAENEEVWKVTEEEKCVYRMDVGTPAVCEDPAAAKSAGAGVIADKEVGAGLGRDEL